MSFPSLSEPPADSSLRMLQGSSPAEVELSSPEPSVKTARRSRAMSASIVLTVIGCCLIGWGVYALLTSIRVFAIVFDGATLVSWKAVIAVIAGALLTFVAVVMAIIAIVRSRPKTLAAIALLCGVVLPAIAAGSAGYAGVEALRRNTFIEARHYAGDVRPESVDAVLAKVESMGIPLPWRHDLVELLRQGKEGTS
ncbi:hypothetical protein QU665_12835 [Actinomyces oris]|uniref:Uncharacterized protein n=1 Tax=Actinomyces oris TaxID=544580 RepID=A0AAW9KZ76_9ACTO|nr:hypothetical protein [Actinomyces oris]MEA1305942.1 hypothetical protein [Actinomyces oris]